MPGEFDHKIWSVTDFKRYHNGTMPDAERHALEKASLEDPFLLDALDGYANVAHPQEDVTAIKERLWPTNKKQAPVLWYKRTKPDMLWKAAAVFIIVGGLGWLIYSNNQENNTEAARDNFAAVEKTTVPNNNNAAILAPDSFPGNSSVASTEISETAKGNQSIAPQSPPAFKEAAPPEDESITRVEKPKASENSKDATVIISVPDPQAGRVVAEEAKSAYNETAKKEQIIGNNLVSGRIVNQQGQPVPYASVVLPDNQGIAADANGNFSIRNSNAANDKVTIKANAVGYETTNAVVANNSTDNNIVLKETDQQFNEVVVTSGFNTRRSSRAPASAQKTKATQWTAKNSKVVLKNATPVNGWNEFYNFMNDSTDLKTFASGKKGRVVLSFSLDNTGKITDYKLKEKLYPAADSLSQLILLQSPPLRIVNAGKKAEASFFFK